MSLIGGPEVFEALFETEHLRTVLLDDELRIVRVNRAFAREVQRTPESLVGVRHFDLRPNPEVEALFREVLRSGETRHMRARPFEHPERDDRTTYWDWTLSVVASPSTSRRGLLLQAIEVTNQVELGRLAVERALLLRETHHRVKNNIQVVSAFLREVSLEHPEARAAVDRALGRVGSIARMHETLTSARDLSSVDLGRYARAIAAELEALHGRGDVEVEVVGRISLPFDVAGPVGMILQELISNSLEHAFPAGRDGRITIGFEVRETDCMIEVCDDGIGLPEVRSRSSGLELVRGLADQIRASFQAYALTPRGTCCHLCLPLAELTGPRPSSAR